MLDFLVLILLQNSSCNENVQSIVNSPPNVLLVLVIVHGFLSVRITALSLKLLYESSGYILISGGSALDDHVSHLYTQILETSSATSRNGYSHLLLLAFR